jgi:hypothetical protein
MSNKRYRAIVKRLGTECQPPIVFLEDIFDAATGKPTKLLRVLLAGPWSTSLAAGDEITFALHFEERKLHKPWNVKKL